MSRDEPDFHVEVRGLETAKEDDPRTAMRPWVGIRFECCGVYSRVYRNREGTGYRGRCPCCLREVRLRVGPGGTDQRFFIAR